MHVYPCRFSDRLKTVSTDTGRGIPGVGRCKRAEAGEKDLQKSEANAEVEAPPI